MRRGYLLVALGCFVLAVTLFVVAVGLADARPQSCMVVVDAAVAEQAAHELVRYQGALQSGVLEDATMGHVQALGELGQALMDAQLMPRGCSTARALW